jgi:hypothetical protein
MCDGPFSRRAVMTYWLLHDVCGALAHDELLSDEFAGNDIHRQVTAFSNGGIALVNRDKGDWKVDNQMLPQYGFIARAGGNEAGITRRGGVISACAKSPGVLFVDARPVNAAQGSVVPKVAGVDDLGNRRFRLHIDWQVLDPVPAGYRPFVHFIGDDTSPNEWILFQGALNLDPAKLAMVGTWPSMCEVTVPPGIAAPADLPIRYGLYDPGPTGHRLPLLASMDSNGRVRGGIIHFSASGIQWEPEPPEPDTAAVLQRLNAGAKLVDFGPAATNGAFRLLYGGADWRLIPLPGSSAFKVQLRLDQLNAGGRSVKAITALNDDGNAAGPNVEFRQNGQSVEFETAAGVFGYAISLRD